MRYTAKYLSYAEAWRRIKAAIQAGYYLEAVTIEESIIADRLLSYVAGIAPEQPVDVRSPFGGLIRRWRSVAGSFPLTRIRVWISPSALTNGARAETRLSMAWRSRALVRLPSPF
jgi:hypothetical protein